MSLITRCPACETMFRVVPDQLRISEGWVRCGQCDEIFDASHHLLQALPDERSSTVAPAPSMAQFDTDAAVPASAAPRQADLDPETTGDVNDLTREPQQVWTPLAAPDTDWSFSGLIKEESPQADEALPSPSGLLTGPAEVAPSDPVSHARPEPVAGPALDVPESELGAGMGDVSFLRRENHNHPLRRKPHLRALLAVLSVTLLLALAGQIVFHERDRIVALAPGLKPWLSAFCRPANCTLSALRRIDSLVIDSASFTKIRGDSYQLNFTLRNTAATALAVPAIEMTLTDSLDQPIVRRVFLPVEFGFKSNVLEAVSEWPGALAMDVKAGAATERVVGYRVLAFYP